MANDALSPKAAAKKAHHPRARSAGAEKVRAVLFADITGTNALYESLGDARALMIITRCLVLLEEQAYEHRGQVIKTIGDEMLSVFPDSSSAAAAAIAMQQRIEHFTNDASVVLGLKIGIRSGALIEEQGDIFGDAVNIAARLVKLAHAGQIITDGPTAASMRATLRRRAREIDRRRVKGKVAEIDIVELGWRRRVGEPFTTEQGALIERTRTARMLLTVEGQEIGIDSARASFTIGRDASNDLPIASRRASRQHARIEWRRDKFVLFDHSTNGTYVTLEGEDEVMVKHESFLLRGRGLLSIGQSAKPGARGVIEFECR
jgi:adenylate cyclase